MPIFNFHKMTNMHKAYAYQFSDFITCKKNLESMCVLCAPNVHSKKAVVCCKVQTLDCALAFANPNS